MGDKLVRVLIQVADEILQLCLPVKFREKIMRISHEEIARL